MTTSFKLNSSGKNVYWNGQTNPGNVPQPACANGGGFSGVNYAAYTATAVPEPGSLCALGALSLAGLMLRRRL